MTEEKKPGESQSESKSQESPKRIYRSKTNRFIGGVCGGLGQYLNIDPLILRVAWAVAVFWGGVGIVAYILCWIIIPENPTQEAPTPKSDNPPKESGFMWGVILIAVGLFFLAREFDWLDFDLLYFPWNWSPLWFGNFDFGVFFSFMLILAGAMYLIHVSNKEKTSETINPKITGGSAMNKRLTRSSKNKMIAGVCGGLANYFNLDPSVVRVVWAILTIAGAGFLGIVGYIVMMVVVPEDSAESAVSGSQSAASETKSNG